MGIKVKAKDQPAYEPMEPGEYKARLSELEEEEEGQFGPQVRFVFEILDDPDYKAQTIRGWASLKVDEDTHEYTFWPGTKLWDWVWALSGGETAVTGEDTELDSLVGKECRIVVGNKSKPDGTIRDRVESVLPPKKGRAKGSVAKQAQAEEDADFESIPF